LAWTATNRSAGSRRFSAKATRARLRAVSEAIHAGLVLESLQGAVSARRIRDARTSLLKLAREPMGESEMRFLDQVVIVTGGAQGIGRACVDAFTSEGAAVVIADIDAAGGTKAAAEIEGRGGRARFIETDVGDAAQAQRLVDRTLEAFGRLDVLINNAGIIKTADFLEISEADFDAVLRVNLKGVFLVGQAAARAMVAQGKGAIVNMSSANAVVAIPNQVPYVTSKGAVNQLTKVMALALADKGVRVNAIGPGSILTDLLRVVMNDDAARRRILARTPMGRCGEPAEIAKVALFLASDDASYLTGQCIYPDGGRLALNYTVPVSE
jgi:glucose 1-dehydrogenase